MKEATRSYLSIGTQILVILVYSYSWYAIFQRAQGGWFSLAVFGFFIIMGGNCYYLYDSIRDFRNRSKNDGKN